MMLNMQKAYNWVRWKFVIKILALFGFSPVFVQWVKQCILTVSFSVLFNGYLTEWFKPQRGLHQGDSLSPYLFILCYEVLSGLLFKA